MSTCAIRYRLNAPGPSALLVELNGDMRIFTRGALGGRLPAQYAVDLTTSKGNHWVPASGELILDLDIDEEIVRLDGPVVGFLPALAVPTGSAAHGSLLA